MEDWFVKCEEISNPEYGKYPGARPVEELIKNGLVIIDKPSGPSSHQVTAWVRDIFSLKKAGHSGTLDPKVTGVLVITLENATKIMPALMGLDKEYVALMHLHKDVKDKKLNEVIKEFTGKIKQLPPRKSAVKREERLREVYDIEILERDEKDVLLKIKCQKGTYVRKLIYDIGEKIGGANMKELRRTKVGTFSEDKAVKLQDLKDAYLSWKDKKGEKIRDFILPVEIGVERLKKIIVKDSAIDSLCNGAPLGVNGVCRIQREIEPEESIVILSMKGELIAIGHAVKSSEEIYKSKKGLAAKVERVLLKRGIYPKMWKV